jgi:hypothetical protein
MQTSPNIVSAPPPTHVARFSVWNLARASAVLACVAIFAVAVVSGLLPCFTAKYLHMPCPGCGATRSTLALLSLDFRGVLRFNPFGPLLAAMLGFIMARMVYFTARDGTPSAIGSARIERVLSHVIVATFVIELAFWGLRFLGLFGGPCPVS